MYHHGTTFYSASGAFYELTNDDVVAFIKLILRIPAFHGSSNLLDYEMGPGLKIRGPSIIFRSTR